MKPTQSPSTKTMAPAAESAVKNVSSRTDRLKQSREYANRIKREVPSWNIENYLSYRKNQQV